MNEDRRAVLESIAFGADARIAPRDRLEALERLKEFDHKEHDTDGLSEEDALAELDSFYSSMLALVFIGSPELEPDVRRFPATCNALRKVVARMVEQVLANGPVQRPASEVGQPVDSPTAGATRGRER